ncbi:MAG: alpha/beta hydrolase family protein [Chromatiales bacterium]|nr:alpha/beta hydrolase family protein [Chromatiales bacterium]
MKVNKIILPFIILLLTLFSGEPSLAVEAVPSGNNGDRLMLKVGGSEVLSLYHHSQTARLDGGVILLHDQGARPDWPGVIQTLRRGLPLYGWSTLSIEMPALGGASKTSSQVLKQWSEMVPARIDAALEELKARKITNIVLIGHGVGALAAADYMIKKPSEQIQGLIAIGMDGSQTEDKQVDGSLLLRKFQKPIFDLYGSRDLESVVGSASRREQTAISVELGKKAVHLRAADIAKSFNQKRAKELSYRQHRFEGADHQFRGYEKQLLRRVVGWLRRYAAIADINSR